MAISRQRKWQDKMRSEHLCMSCGKKKTPKLKFLYGGERYAAFCEECYKRRRANASKPAAQPIPQPT